MGRECDAKWLYHTGLPAKSFVGAGIIAVSPGKFGIAVISPPLDSARNGVRAQKAIADISNALGGNRTQPSCTNAVRMRIPELSTEAVFKPGLSSL